MSGKYSVESTSRTIASNDDSTTNRTTRTLSVCSSLSDTECEKERLLSVESTDSVSKLPLFRPIRRRKREQDLKPNRSKTPSPTSFLQKFPMAEKFLRQSKKQLQKHT